MYLVDCSGSHGSGSEGGITQHHRDEEYGTVLLTPPHFPLQPSHSKVTHHLQCVCGLGEPTPTAHPLGQVWWRRSDAGATPQVWRPFLLPACLWTVTGRREGMLHESQRHRNQGLPLFTSGPDLSFVRVVTVCTTLLLEVNDGGDHWPAQRACLCSETCG